MMFPWGLDCVVTKIEYIPNKIKYQFKYGISTKEENKVQYKGNKENVGNDTLSPFVYLYK